MENSLGVFNSADDEVATSEPSLLLLNDDCLIQLFKRLELLDFVNLAKTCVRLKNVAGDTFVHKFQSVVINDEREEYPTSIKVTKQQFSDVLSLIGGRVLSIELCDGYDFLLQTVTDKCKNVNSLALWYCKLNISRQLQEFKNLKELRIYDCDISNFHLFLIFINNPGIETLAYDWAYKGFSKLLRLLPKLKDLRLDRIIGLNSKKFPNLFHSKEVTSFQFYSPVNCNKFLIEIATQWKLVELDFDFDTNKETFDLIKLFENLENLRIARGGTIPTHTVFPPKLKRISFYAIRLTYRSLASIVKQLKLLEQIRLDVRCMQSNSGKLF